MSSFVPEKEHLREALLFCFNLKKSAAESHRMLVEAYGDSALSETTCRDWFRRFKDGHFDLSDKKRENRPKKVEDHDQQGVVYYELLKPGETVDAHRYHQQLIKLRRALREKRPDYEERHEKLIFLHDNAPSHTSKMVQNYLKTLNWEVLPHPAYSPDLAPSDYHLFSSMGHALAEQHFDSYEDVGKWLDEWFASKDKDFFWRGIHKLPERWGKCIASKGKYFE